MGSDFGLVYPLWTDPQASGELLDRAIGEVGLDHVTIPVVTGPQEQFRPNPAQPPHYFATEGGWHFPPDPNCYKGGSARPRPARWFGKRDVLSRVCEYAGRRDVAVIVRIDLRAVTALVEHAPHLRRRNAWGDEVALAGACVLNPDLRELLRGTLEDLLRYEPAGFELVDWAPDLPVVQAGPRPLDWHPPVRELLDICFCPACRQIANVAGTDPDQAARSAQVHVERVLTQPEVHEPVAKVHSDELLDAYRQARRRDTAVWLQQVAGAHGRRRRYLLSDAATLESIEPLLGKGAFLLLVRTGRPPLTVEEDALQGAVRLLDRAHGLTLPVWQPAVKQAGQLVRKVAGVIKAGASFLDFEGLEEAPTEAIDWLRQAVRFARRG
jgi:hypothetical protein